MTRYLLAALCLYYVTTSSSIPWWVNEFLALAFGAWALADFLVGKVHEQSRQKAQEEAGQEASLRKKEQEEELDRDELKRKQEEKAREELKRQEDQRAKEDANRKKGEADQKAADDEDFWDNLGNKKRTEENKPADECDLEKSARYFGLKLGNFSAADLRTARNKKSDITHPDKGGSDAAQKDTNRHFENLSKHLKEKRKI